MLDRLFRNSREGLREIFKNVESLHEHSVLGWQILNYPEDFFTDEGSVKKLFKIAVGVCESCQKPVMIHTELDQPWPEKYEHDRPRNRLLFTEGQRVAQ